MWSRFKKRFFGGSRKTADDASSLDEAMVHTCVLTDADDVRKSRQTLKQFAKDDLHTVPPTTAPGDKGGGGGGGGKLRRKLSWFGAKSRRPTKSMTSLNSDKRRSGDAAILATKVTTSAAATESADVVQTTAAQPASEPTAGTTTSATSTTDKPSTDEATSGVQPNSVVHVPSTKTTTSLLNIDKSLLVSRDDVWCNRGVEFKADKGTFGASSTSHIEELQRPVSLPVSAADAKTSPPKLKRRAKAASQSESETRKCRLSKSLPEPPDVSPSAVERPLPGQNPSPAVTTETSAQVPAVPCVDTADSTKHLKSSLPSIASAGRRVPPPVPVRKYPPQEPPSEVPTVTAGPATASLAAAAAAAVVEESQLSPSPTRNSPDSGSDDTEGKESGYVTLDDLQAQLMRSSWSSDERDVTDSHSNATPADSLKGNRLCCYAR